MFRVTEEHIGQAPTSSVREGAGRKMTEGFQEEVSAN